MCVSTMWSVHILCIVLVKVLFFVRQRHIKLMPSSFCIEDQAVIGDVVSPRWCIWTVGMVYSLRIFYFRQYNLKEKNDTE